MNPSALPQRRQLVVLIATADRPRLLMRRALSSVLVQSVTPDRIIVVDDSKQELAKKVNYRCLQRSTAHVEYLHNRRTRGLSGALNSGLDHCLRTSADPSSVFIAILDDDDAWEPDHLHLCFKVAIQGSFNMVASGLIRHEQPNDTGHQHSIPEALNARELFVRGQHIQGSNLFVRLDVLLLAGCFDEHLPSCTDRDLCIRLSDLKSLHFGRTNNHTVHHFADPRRDRLSTPSSPAKANGLTRFWQKHAPRFDAKARDEFCARARDIFGWTAPGNEPATETLPPLVSSKQFLALIVGFITDSDVLQRARGILDDLLGLRERPDVKIITLVIVENGPLRADYARPLHSLIAEYQAKGMPIELIDIERQHRDWLAGILVDTPDASRRKMPIAVSRTVLNTYVARAAQNAPGTAAWILDDDKRLTEALSV